MTGKLPAGDDRRVRRTRGALRQALVALIIERAFTLRRAKIVPAGLLDSVIGDFRMGGGHRGYAAPSGAPQSVEG